MKLFFDIESTGLLNNLHMEKMVPLEEIQFYDFHQKIIEIGIILVNLKGSFNI